MKQKLLRLSSVLAAIVFMVVFFGLAIKNTPRSVAVKATDFKAGRIIDDAIFYNSNTMTVAQIQTFLDKHLPACDMWGTQKIGYGYYIKGKAVDPNSTRASYAKRMRLEAGDKRYHDPPYVCINKYYENPTTHQTNFETKGVAKSGMLSAAQIIYNAAKEFNINPQVLLVMLKKESYAWGDDWPTKNEYNTVMGYACPDHAACNTKYYGFYNQVNMAAWQLKYYKEHIYSYNYRPYVNNKIYYSPDSSCGTKTVYIENIATASLYIYTPYTPNNASLKNYPGTASCGSYGNRNFFMYFSDWFGTTFASFKTTAVNNGNYRFSLAEDDTKTLQLVEKSKNNSVKLTVAKKKAAEEDTFTIKKKSNGKYVIINTFSNNALDTPSGKAVADKILQQYQQNNGTPQEWKFYDNGDGSVSIASTITGNLVAGLVNDRIALTPYTKAASQRFKLTSVNNATLTGTNSTSSNQNTTTNNENTSTQTPTPSKQTIADGRYNVANALAHSYMLDVKGGKTADGTVMQLFQRNNAAAQVFDITYDQKVGYYKIKTVLANKYVSVAKDNKSIQLQTWSGSCGQYWTISKSEGNRYNIASKCVADKVLQAENGKIHASTPVQLVAKRKVVAQEWKFELINKKKQIIANGRYSFASALKKNFMLDVKDAVYKDGQNIQSFKRDNTSAQNFNITYDAAKKMYRISSVKGGKYLTVTNKKNGANVFLWKKINTCQQYWDIVKTKTGKYNLFNACSAKVLAVGKASTANGANAIVWRLNWHSEQEWTLERK